MRKKSLSNQERALDEPSESHSVILSAEVGRRDEIPISPEEGGK